MAGDAVASVVASATGRDADLCGAEGPSARASPERERERESARARERERERERESFVQLPRPGAMP